MYQQIKVHQSSRANRIYVSHQCFLLTEGAENRKYRDKEAHYIFQVQFLVDRLKEYQLEIGAWPTKQMLSSKITQLCQTHFPSSFYHLQIAGNGKISSLEKLIMGRRKQEGYGASRIRWGRRADNMTQNYMTCYSTCYSTIVLCGIRPF